MDDGLALALTLASGGLSALAIAADAALQHYSHSKLEKRVEDSERLQALALRLKDFDALALSLSLFQALCAVGFLGSLAVWRGIESASLLPTFLMALGVYVIALQGLLRAVVARAAESVLLALMGFIEIVHRSLAVIRVPVSFIGYALGRSFGAPVMTTEQEEAVEDILDAVAEGEAEGHIEEGAADFIENIMEYKDRIVREVMTPRTAMVCAPRDATVDEVLALVAEHGYSKLPIYGDNRDDVVGVVFLKDLVRAGERGSVPAESFARKAFFVPETKKISELLREFQGQKSQIAIVLDEFGGTSGLVTVEDIVEEIVGELEDEFDAVDDGEGIRRLDDRNYEIDAKTPIDTINELLPVAIPEDGEYETVGGFLAAKLGKVPETGEQFEMEGLEFVVTAADERRVDRVKITTVPLAPPA